MNKTNLINSIYKMWVAINWIATWYLEHQMIISLVVDMVSGTSDDNIFSCRHYRNDTLAI